jgi:uncharacterized protein (DUF305 family)
MRIIPELLRKAVLLALPLAGCAAAPRAVEASTPAPAANVRDAPADSGKVTEADIRFMSGMIGHHAQAIVMAKLAPSHGASPTIQILCARIINAQRDEIALMQQWLRDHKQPAPDPDDALKMMSQMPDMMMPGMLSPTQMQQLDAARGEDFDILFLKYMIQHHTGATSMVKDLFATNGAAQDDTVFKLASDVNVDQTTEIARMQHMLYELLFGKEHQ